MKRHTKLTSAEQHEQQTAAQQKQHQSAREFATVEEMLRYDAAQTPAPPIIAQRLQTSVKKESQRASPWWRRLFH